LFYAGLARFYGWSHKEISEMPYSKAKKYWKAINVLQAREYLVDININNYHRFKTDSKKRFYSDLRKQAYPAHLEKRMDFEEFAKKVGMLNG